MMLLGLGMQGLGGAIKGGTQLGMGIADRRRGREMEEAAGDRPEYEIPESVEAMMNLYRQSAQSGMPGYDIAKGDIQASTARTAGVAGQLADSPVAALTALGGAQDRELGALRDLNRRASEYQAMSQQNLARAYGQKAGYETEQWRQNELMPWEIQMNRAMQLQSGGKGNIMGAADSFGSTLAQGGGTMATMGMYNQMYPNMGAGAQAPQNTSPQTWPYSNQQNLPYF